MRRGAGNSSSRTPEGNDETGEALAEQLASVVRSAFDTVTEPPVDQTAASAVPASETDAVLDANPTVGGDAALLSADSVTADAEPKERAGAGNEPAPPTQRPEAKMPPNNVAADEPLPARMLNEFVYCPRLFFYEYVEGIFVHSADTLRGAAIHSRVDKGSGALPAAPAATTSAAQARGDAPRTEEQGDPAATTTDGGPRETPSPPPPLETIHSRSVMLGSQRLGVTAKLDLVESRGSPDDLFAVEVCPVDYKAGAPREGSESLELWDTDRMQLGLQILLLRDNGYACSRGIIYYRATKQRVALDLTAELETWIVQQIAAARDVVSRNVRPPPLVDSPKCVRCSLAPVCLPDETLLLAARSASMPPSGTATGEMPGSATIDGSPRRLMAPRDDTRALYLNTPGLRVGLKDRVLSVKEKDKTLDEIRLADVHHVALFGNIQLSTQAIHELCRQDIPVSYFSGGGWFYGITRGHSLPNILLRRQQFRAADDPAICLRLSRAFVNGKIRNHRTLLMRNHAEPPAPVIAKLRNSAGTAAEADSIESLLGIEGAAAALYFSEFAGMLKPEDDSPGARASSEPQLVFDFAGRNRRPPTDPLNALLSLAYSLLSKDCTVALLAAGFDPWLGFYHQPRPGRPALALDLMEEFRPLIAESAVLAAVNNRMVCPPDFVRAGDAVNLSADGRKRFFQAYELRMNHTITHPVFDYKVCYRRALELQARLLARAIEGEIPDYLPLLTR